MAEEKPVSLLGRLAVQLEFITPDQLRQVILAQAELPDKRIGDVLVEMGFVDTSQLQKLILTQKQVLAKHRARQASGLVEKPAPRRDPRSDPGAPQPARRPSPEDTHARADRAAQQAAPVTSAVVDEISEQPATAQPVRAETPPQSDPQPVPVPPPVPAAAPEDQAAPEAVHTPSVPSLELSLPDPTADDRKRLEQLLASAVEAGASDIHIHSGSTIKLRIHGELVDKEPTPLAREDAERLVAAALTPDERRQLCNAGELDYCFEIDGVGRFRANTYRQQRGMDVVYRTISAEPPSLESLGLPTELAKYANYHQGMVLITGPSGCGKSATLAAFVDLVNEDRDEHILTIEDPIEVLHPSKRCIVNQRHAGHHSENFARALRGALREDPDIIVIGELRDIETISLAMTAAETGHFVLATLHTNNAVRTIGRMIGAFPPAEQSQVRAMLSESLRAVISQRLVPRADGQGRVPAFEVLVVTKAIGNLIRDEKTVQIRSSIQTGRAQGMVLLEQSLNKLVAEGLITRETALAHAEDQQLITEGV